MATRDSEIDVMAAIVELLGALDPQAQRRVATWIHARFTGAQVPDRHGQDPLSRNLLSVGVHRIPGSEHQLKQGMVIAGKFRRS